MMQIERLLVVGAGLIGSSFALALKQQGAVGSVLGWDADAATLATARTKGAIDVVASASDWHTCDAVLIATPVGAIDAVLREVAPQLKPDAIITDAGSTKAGIAQAARALLGSRLPNFVPGHPIAGREQSGPAAASADLFANRQVVLTPLPETAPAATAQVEAWWRTCGARVARMTPEHHDQVFAAVSHLPHLLAYALVDELAARGNADEVLAFAAGGFRDFTRIASSSPRMWCDIALANRAPLLAEIDAYQARLSRVRALVDAQDAAGLETMMAEARRLRDAWLTRFEAPASGAPE